MRWAILDTTVYIGHWERGLYEEALAAIRKAFVIRRSAVVLSALRRGARTRDAQRLVEALYRLAPLRWEPTAPDWWEAGRLIRRVGDAHRWDKSKRRDFQVEKDHALDKELPETLRDCVGPTPSPRHLPIVAVGGLRLREFPCLGARPQRT